MLECAIGSLPGERKKTVTKRIKALATFSAALCLSAALPLSAAPHYVGLDSEAVNRYYNQAARNISCSWGTHLNGPHWGVTEHFIHTGPLGYCGRLYASTGDYHIIAVYYYKTAGGNTSVPSDPAYGGKDPRATAWKDIDSGKERQVTDWIDQNRDGQLNAGDQVAYDGGKPVPVERTGTAALVEDDRDAEAGTGTGK